jgi:hypothetical protein
MIKTFESGAGTMAAPTTGGNSSNTMLWVFGTIALGLAAWWGYNTFIKKPAAEKQ